MSELSRLLEHPAEIPHEGAFTGFLGLAELSEWLPRFAERRMLEAVFGGHRMPRRVMLHILPKGEGFLHSSRLREELARQLSTWDELAESFPVRWLRLELPASGEAFEQARRTGSWVRLLASQGVQPEWCGDVLDASSETSLLVDSRRLKVVQGAFGRLGILSEEMEGPATLTTYARPSTAFVSSPRLDALVGKVFRMAREEAKKAVTRGFVSVNLMAETSASLVLAPEDLIDCELEGRALVQEMSEKERGSRFRVQLAVLKNARLWRGAKGAV